MDNTMTVSSLPTSYDAYIRHNWSLVPIPPGTKGPRHAGWNKKENALQSGVSLPAGYGVGLAHAYSGTMALDIDDYTNAKRILAEHDIDIDALGQAPDAVTIDSGNPGHGKLLYAMPFGMTMPTKKILYSENGVNKTAFELRCASLNGLTVQDILPPSQHISSGKPYTWGGRGHWSRLPTIPMAILNMWSELVKADTEKTIRQTGTHSTSWDEIRAALFAISPDCGRDAWVQIGMALHSAGTQTNQLEGAMALWDEWSASSLFKYKGPQDIAACWRSFKAEDGITIGTLFHYAREAGWHRPISDVSEFFNSVTPTPPKMAGAYLRPPPPDVDMSVWPKILVDRAKEIGESRGCDPLVPLMAGLAAACGAADARIRLELMNEYEVPPVLWIMTIGDPADKKTPGSTPMFDVLSDIEKADLPRYQTEMLIWEGKEALYAATKKEYMTKAANPLEIMGNDAPLGLAPLPPQPVPVRLKVDDITSQKLVRTVADRPHGVLCHLDEMAGWVKKMGDRMGGEDRSTWVRGYEAKSYYYDRVSAGSIVADCFAVSLYGNIQPRVLRETSSGLSSDGLLQRFIPVVLREQYTKRGEPVPPYLSTKGAYEDAIRRIYTLPERKYTLTQGAFESFREFQLWYESVKRDERVVKSNETYMTALGKVEGTCGRMALVFHLIQDPYSAQVSKQVMDQAITVIKRFVIPSFRYVYNVLSGYADDSLDQWVMDRIIQLSGETDRISLSELRRSARRQLENMSPSAQELELRFIMDWLATQYWVTLIDENRRSAVWAINPNLATTFHDHRDTVIQAKQRLRDEMLGYFEQKHEPKDHWVRKVIGNK